LTQPQQQQQQQFLCQQQQQQQFLVCLLLFFLLLGFLRLITSSFKISQQACMQQIISYYHY